MTGSASSSSSFSYQWTYDVFISFRGEDTRHGFTGHLYNALKKAGVHTFFDDEEIRRGDEITPTLLKAIENSRMAVTVFSKNYASSTFCLNELVKIHECIKMEGRLVWPIFYDVEPSTVRQQKDNYKQALSMHIENLRADEDKIQSWKLALREVANISGYHFTHGKNVYEHEFIETIVKEISSKIKRGPLHVSEYPIGLESRVKEITSLLQIESNEKAIMVGIYGMGGLGKTTIARALYNSIADDFDGLCFLHDVKEKSMKPDLERIQETILSNIVGEDIKIQDVNEGVEQIKRRFKKKKILLILDNVDNSEQLKKLAGGCDWFGGGSRIIITSRDEQLLKRHGVQSIYTMEAFNHEESLELLSWNAFKNHPVDPSYEDVLNRAIVYAQGLPLALEIIGANLYGMSISECKSALNLYEKIPEENILQRLKVSYDGLTKEQQNIFLDIACFFKGTKLEHAKFMVEQVYDFNPEYVIKVLVNKCLMKIVRNVIEMHDLIQDMGREIVRRESIYNPGKRSRLFFHQDIVDVLEDNKGTNKVRMIIQDTSSKCIEVNWDGKAFKNMTGLKILILKNVKFSQSPAYLPRSLRVLEWKGHLPSSPLSLNFCPKKLLGTIKTSNNLKILNLEDCQYVTEIPDLSDLQNLKELNLKSCKNLIEIHDSIGLLAKLEILNVGSCVRLKTFPRTIKLPSLRELYIGFCSNLTYFPETPEKTKITRLSIYGTGIKKLPRSICNLTELRNLWILRNKSAIEIPNNIFLLPKVELIKIDGNEGNVTVSCNLNEAEQQAIRSMEVQFFLSRCNISDDLLTTCISRFINMRLLDLTGNNFTILPSWIKQCHFLKELKLNECKILREVEGIPPNIILFEAKNCMILSPESKSLLLSEELHGHRPVGYSFPGKCFSVPSSSIPEWFEHRSKGSTISFWSRGNSPALCLCLLLKPTYAVLKSNYSCTTLVSVSMEVFLNDETAKGHSSLWSRYAPHFDGDHLVVYNLQELHMEQNCQNEWNHVKVYAYSSSNEAPIIEEIGIHVMKQRYDMERITFNNPHQTLDSTCAIQGKEQFDTRMKEKKGALNKKRELMWDDNFASGRRKFNNEILKGRERGRRLLMETGKKNSGSDLLGKGTQHCRPSSSSSCSDTNLKGNGNKNLK